MIWVKYVLLSWSSFIYSQKRQKTISIPHWYRYGLSKNEQSKFGLIPPPHPPILAHWWISRQKVRQFCQFCQFWSCFAHYEYWRSNSPEKSWHGSDPPPLPGNARILAALVRVTPPYNWSLWLKLKRFTKKCYMQTHTTIKVANFWKVANLQDGD